MEMKGISFLDYRNLLVSSVKFELSSPKVDIVITLMCKKQKNKSILYLIIIILRKASKNSCIWSLLSILKQNQIST